MPGSHVPMNIAAARTLDAVAKTTPSLPLPSLGRPRMWPHVPWQLHAAFVVLTGAAIFFAYRNSFGVNDRPPAVNWTLDNKYIIELDPRTKAEADLFRYSTWTNPQGKPDFADIWTRDYWWPKGISGLYRPVVTFTYWLNWYKMSGDESRIDPAVNQTVLDTVPIETRLLMLRDVAQQVNVPLPLFKSAAPKDQFDELRNAIRQAIVKTLPEPSQQDRFELQRVDDRIAAELYSRIDFPTREKALRTILGADAFVEQQLAAATDPGQREIILRNGIREARTEPIVRDRLLVFHTINYWGHFLVTVLVYLLSLHLTQRYWTAAAIGLLFGLHPVATESVTNIIGRADIFASITTVGGLLLYIRSTLSRTFWKIPWLIALMLLTTVGVFSKESAISVVGAVVLYDLVFRFTPAAIRKFLFVTLGLGIAGYFFHLVAGTLVAGAIIGPVALYLLIDRLVKNPRELIRDPWASVWVWIATFGPPVAAMAIARSMVFGASTPPETPFLDNPIRGVNWFAGEITALQVLVRLWWILIYPKDLCADYSFNQVPTFGYLSTPLNNIMGLLAAVLVIGVVAFAVYLWWRNYKAAAFFVLFFFVVFMPTSNILITIGSIMAERFLYLPLVGFVGALVLAIEWVINRLTPVPVASRAETGQPAPQPSPHARFVPPSWIATSFFAVLCIVYGVRTYYRNFVWRSDLTLWQASKEISPISFRSYQSYAFALFEEFQKPKEKRQPETRDVTIDDCIEWVTKGRPIVDELPDRLNSSRLYLHQGMYNGVKAEALCQKQPDGTLLVTPESQKYFQVSIEALERGRRVDRAFNEVNRQKEIERGKKIDEIADAGLLQVYEYLGLSYFRLGQLDQALDNYLYMRHLDPWNADGYEKVAMVYLQASANEAAAKRPQQAAQRAEQAAIALIQVLWFDQSRRHLWPVLERQLQMIETDNIPPLQPGQDGTPKLNLQCQTVRSTLCSSYQGIVRLLLEARQQQNAEFVRVMAVRDLGFPQGLFDDIFKEFKLTPGPIPPRPGAPPTPGAPAPSQPPKKAN